jgi:hypothetical protein
VLVQQCICQLSRFTKHKRRTEHYSDHERFLRTKRNIELNGRPTERNKRI